MGRGSLPGLGNFPQKFQKLFSRLHTIIEVDHLLFGDITPRKLQRDRHHKQQAIHSFTLYYVKSYKPSITWKNVQLVIQLVALKIPPRRGEYLCRSQLSVTRMPWCVNIKNLTFEKNWVGRNWEAEPVDQGEAQVLIIVENRVFTRRRGTPIYFLIRCETSKYAVFSSGRINWALEQKTLSQNFQKPGFSRSQFSNFLHFNF